MQERAAQLDDGAGDNIPAAVISILRTALLESTAGHFSPPDPHLTST
jgi:hypothetical protein